MMMQAQTPTLPFRSSEPAFVPVAGRLAVPKYAELAEVLWSLWLPVQPAGSCLAIYVSHRLNNKTAKQDVSQSWLAKVVQTYQRYRC
jgi:hypothetical protein